jgi:hypothetical protein
MYVQKSYQEIQVLLVVMNRVSHEMKVKEES